MKRALPLAFVLLLSACAEEAAAPRATSPFPSPVFTSPTVDAAAIAAYETCKEESQPLLDKLEDLESRLNVGLSFEAYGERVGDIRVEYDKFIKGILDLDPKCINAAVGMENAVQSYIDAYNEWNECIGDINCPEVDEKKLQKHWLKASAHLIKARTRLEKMREKAEAP